SPAKVQSALLEAMGERQVTIGRETYFLPDIFMVMATQNPIEQEGTYPLPEAQLDRFLLHVKVGYPPPEKELEIVRLVRDESRGMLKQKNEGPETQDYSRKTDMTENHKSQGCLVDQEQIKDARRENLEVYISPEVERYQVELIQATRFPENYHEELARWLEWGASPRASLALDRCSRAQAWLVERDFV
ncbi:MAG: MoxR family ATPase, partial [Candidatus Latescibacterota bacterium]|nr:MoxR family ATPase [Candidatus Latescibacterota bacterium]